MLGYFRKTYKASFAGVKPLDVNFFSRYEPDYGFRVEFGCIYGVKPFKDSIYQVLTSVCPPGVPYTGAPNKMVQAYKIQKVDWDKAYPEYFVFDEDEVSLKNVKLGFSSFVVFDIKRYNFETKESFDFGFAVLPMV